MEYEPGLGEQIQGAMFLLAIPAVVYGMEKLVLRPMFGAQKYPGSSISPEKKMVITYLLLITGLVLMLLGK